MSKIDRIKAYEDSNLNNFEFDKSKDINQDTIYFDNMLEQHEFPGNTFGGDQGSLINNFDTYKKDPYFKEIVSKYYPYMNNLYLKANLELFKLYGCGYVAAINTLFLEYGDDINKIANIIGVDRECFIDENGNIDYKKAYDYVTLDFVLYNERKNYGLLLPNSAFFYDDTMSKFFTKYLKDNNISITCDYINDEINEIINASDDYKKNANICEYIDKALEEGYVLYVNAREGEKIYAEQEDGSLSSAMRLPGGHCMTVVGTKDNKIIVSSWGKKYYLDPIDDGDHKINGLPGVYVSNKYGPKRGYVSIKYN